MISWNAFTWEAFATLFTGVVAVLAAVYVGRRQLRIADRQSDILDRQTKLATLTHRAGLFERRFEVYDSTARFLSAILTRASKPEPELERKFLVALNASNFLFAPGVAQSLREIWKESCAFFATKSVMEANYERTGSYGEGMPQKELEQITGLQKRLESLGDVFGDELRLTEEG